MMCPPQSVKIASTPSALRARATRWPPVTARAAGAAWRSTAVAIRLPPSALEEGGRDLPALYLARRRARQLLREVNHLGHLEVGQAAAAVRLELFHRRLALEHHGGVNLLAVLRVGGGEGGDLGHGRVVEQHGVDLQRRDLLAAAVDQ